MEHVEAIEAKLRRLSPETRREAMACIDRLLTESEKGAKERSRGPYVSRGSLADVGKNHTSAELQHRALDWWTS
ncbi:MAG: hypothetical protein ABFC38_03890 [Methanospirillum sp.]